MNKFIDFPFFLICATICTIFELRKKYSFVLFPTFFSAFYLIFVFFAQRNFFYLSALSFLGTFLLGFFLKIVGVNILASQIVFIAFSSEFCGFPACIFSLGLGCAFALFFYVFSSIIPRKKSFAILRAPFLAFSMPLSPFFAFSALLIKAVFVF